MHPHTRPSFPAPRDPPPRRPPAQRGAALLVVLTTVAVLTALAVDLAYRTRVSLQSAANARDELRAACLAKSAVALSRLVLHFQQQLDRSAGNAGALAGRLPGQAAQASQASAISFRLWELVPVDSSSVAMFLSGEPAAGSPPARAPAPAGTEDLFGAGTARAFGDYQGSFRARVDDEDRKVNVAQLAGLSTAAAPQLVRLLSLVREQRFDYLFDREDANGFRATRPEVAIALKDWVDEDEVTSVLGRNPAVPFEAGYGDENAAYDRGPDRYRAKNARFDSLEELHLVAGLSDGFMSAFGDRLTVYPDVNAPTNINTSDPQQMLVNILAMSDPPGIPQPVVLDPMFQEKLEAALRLVRPFPFMALNVQQLATVLTALGVRLQAIYRQAANTDARIPFGNRSSTFRILGIGKVGSVTRNIEAVVTFDSRAGPLASSLGRLLHWREE